MQPSLLSTSQERAASDRSRPKDRVLQALRPAPPPCSWQCSPECSAWAPCAGLSPEAATHLPLHVEGQGEDQGPVEGELQHVVPEEGGLERLWRERECKSPRESRAAKPSWPGQCQSNHPAQPCQLENTAACQGGEAPNATCAEVTAKSRGHSPLPPQTLREPLGTHWMSQALLNTSLAGAELQKLHFTVGQTGRS